MSILEKGWFSGVRRPSRYIGNEINAIKKDLRSVEVSIALAFPDIYEVGMSHLGLKILYHLLNSYTWLAAERVFCPWVDLEKELRERALPLASMESARALSDFDIVGFSLQHELSFTNVLTMLDLSGIPFLTQERNLDLPFIIGGGPACFNPEPVASLFDAFVIGDGERSAIEICKAIREAKRRGVGRKDEILAQLANIRGVYVPKFFEVHYEPRGTVGAIEPMRPGYTEVEKATIPDITQHPCPERQVVPFAELVHDRLTIEISRGCTRGCRFCQAGMIYRPVRERDPDSVIRNAERSLRLTGFEELSLLSLSSGDYSCLGPLLKKLMDSQSGDRIAVSLPSLRVDSLDPTWFEQIKRVRKTGFTLAPEAGNDRLRRVINKGMSNEQILKMASEVYQAGWNLIKMYFMVGLPGEEESDVEDIAALSRDVSKAARVKGQRAKLKVSLATFVPKSHTPFMWAPQLSLEESQRRIRLVKDALKDTRVRVKWNQPEISWLEGIFARGDRRLTKVLIRAWLRGARFDAWSEHFNRRVWKEALKESGLDPAFYLYRVRSKEEILPWDHIKSGVTKAFLEREWKRSMAAQTTPDCRKTCLECGVCDHEKVAPVIFEPWTVPSLGERPLSTQASRRIRKYRITFSKTSHAKYLSHLELVRVFIRAFKRAGLNMVYSKGYHPMPKVSFVSALPVGTESLHETVDVQVYETMGPMPVKENISRQLPSGIGLIHLEEMMPGAKNATIKESHFEITVNGLRLDRGDLERFLQSDYFPIGKKTKQGEKAINARALVKSMSLNAPHKLSLVLEHTPGPGLRPRDIVKEIFHLSEKDLNATKILKIKQVL
jgi:radical SAM family uncharacterized protein/radical SAM-linked protein